MRANRDVVLLDTVKQQGLRDIGLIYGYNPNTTLTTLEEVWRVAGTYTGFLTAAETMDVFSSAVADDGSPVGTGARTVLLTGLSAAGVVQSETITLNGIGVVVSALSYLRVFSVAVVTVGSGETNAGNITVRSTSGLVTCAYIAAGDAISYQAIWQVPASRSMLIYGIACLQGGGTSSIVITVSLETRATNGPWIVQERIACTNNVGVVEHRLLMPLILAAGTDVRLRSTSTIAGRTIGAWIEYATLDV